MCALADSIVRGETWKLSFCPEPVYGTDPGTTYLNSVFGVVQTMTSPDPEMEWQPIWALGSASTRNFYINYKGRLNLVGSIPDVWILEGTPLYLPIGTMATVGTDSGAGGSTVAAYDSVLTANCMTGATTCAVTSATRFHEGQLVTLYDSTPSTQNVTITDITDLVVTFTPAATDDFTTVASAVLRTRETYPGDTIIDVADGTGYLTDDYIQTGETTVAEVRKITNVATNTITLDYPLLFHHLVGAVCNEVISPYTHTISEASRLGSITLQHEMFDSDGNSELIRRWSGGKIGRATYSGSEGEELKMSLDEIIFRSYAVDGDSGVATATLDYPTTQPFIFSYGALTLWGTEFARIRNFSIDVGNALEPRYYVTNDATARLPYEIHEGRREYRVGVTLDITDSTLFDELNKFGTNQGTAVDGLFKGFDMAVTFTRGAGDTITFTLPPSAAAAGGDAQGLFIRSAKHNIVTDPQVSVPLDLIARSMKITVVNSIANMFNQIV